VYDLEEAKVMVGEV